jgi:hypothetical protein
MHKSKFLLLALLGLSALCPLIAAPSKKPKLVVAIVVDQFRYDYLTRFRGDYNAGLARLLDRGAVYTNAFYDHFPTVTAVGHSTFLSGATPAVSGIIGNEWFDRESHKVVTSVEDDSTQLVGATGKGASPRRLLVSTLGDELKIAHGKDSRVISVSIKDRSAILPVGHMSDGSYWFDAVSGNFVTSTFYVSALPVWVAKFNDSGASRSFLGHGWLPFDAKPGATPFVTLPSTADKKYFDDLERTPYGNEITERFAEAAIDGEQLGRHAATDLLAISFSSNDRIGHVVGPDAPEVRDISVQTDRQIGKLLAYVESKIGSDYVVVLTADHGVAPMAELMKDRKMPGGRLDTASVQASLLGALNAKYGAGRWLEGTLSRVIYLNHSLIAEKKLSEAEVENTAAEALRSLPHMFRIYTRTDFLSGRNLSDQIDRRMRNGFNQVRGGDLFVLTDPYWVWGKTGTDHSTPFGYDAHVPVILYGTGIKAGRYNRPVIVNDIAPTLATLLDIEIPSGSIGSPLVEALSQ